MEITARKYPLAEVVCWSQGVYYGATGLWPLLSVESFQLVTGRKTDHLIATHPTEADHWMLYTITLLIVAISLVILRAAWFRNVTADVILLGLLSAAALTGIDIVYVARGTLRPVYLLDAAAEMACILGWLVVVFRTRTDTAQT